MDNTFDRLFYGEGERIGGVDESGVSDIAGPLVAACVILPKIDLQRDDLRIFNIGDCKQVPSKYLQQNAEIIWQAAIAVGIGEVTPAEIDYLERSRASRLAMLRAVAACKTIKGSRPVRPDFLIVDGPGHAGKSWSEKIMAAQDPSMDPVLCDVRQHITTNADEKSLCVAAASIVAKVYRDDVMLKLHARYPYYDWASNKGFPCESHFCGLDEYGVQIGIHRVKFWPFVVGAMETKRSREEKPMWDARRRLWRRVTETKLGMELGGNLWTSKPPLWRPSTSSKDSPLRGVTTIRSSSEKSA